MRRAINRRALRSRIALMTKLERLNISHTRVTVLEPLRYLPRMSSLQVYGAPLVDLAPLADRPVLTGAVQLDLTETALRSVVALNPRALARIIHHAAGCDLRGAGISWRTAGSHSSSTSSTILAALPGVRPDLPRAAWSRSTSW